MAQLSKDIYSVIADFIPDVQTWYNYCLTCKLVWSACKFKIAKIQNKFTYPDVIERNSVLEKYVRLRHNNKLHGAYSRSKGDKLEETGHYKNGKKHGVWTKYDINGVKLWECSFANDWKHGEEYDWSATPSPQQKPNLTTWFEGKKNGPDYVYSKSGQISVYTLWAYGERIESVEYYQGKILRESRLPDGYYKEYYPETFIIKEHTCYQGRKKHGVSIKYNMDGSIVSNIMYNNDIIVNVGPSNSTGIISNEVKDGWRLFFDKSSGEYLYRIRFVHDIPCAGSLTKDPL